MPAKKAAQNANAPSRALPKQRNHLLTADESPGHDHLVSIRRLGQTILEVQPGQVGTNNATKPENLGVFDYAHLRAPLPKDLKGSEIFAPHGNQSAPESYFLMRRSSDGFVSATGMFKAAFPWAKHTEEQAEKDHVKELTQAAPDEVAGNVWISEHLAIELAHEYGITTWITALLDSAPISVTEQTAMNSKAISPPPKFKFTAGDKPHLPPPNGTMRESTPKARGRPARGASPTKATSPVKASTKKPKETKKQREAQAAAAKEASALLQESVDVEAQDTTASLPDGEASKVKVDVRSTVETEGDTETTTTNVHIAMPQGSADLPLPENPEQMIETAKRMVEEAKALDEAAAAGGPASSSSSSKKRKVEEILDDEDEEADNELVPTKRARVAEQMLKRERVRNRAMVGVAATLAIGAIIPYFTG